MTRLVNSALALVAVGATLAGCGNAGSDASVLRARGAQPDASPSVSFFPTPIRGTAPAIDYRIDWSNPLPDGDRVDPQALASAAPFGLDFTPFIPQFSTPASTAFVSIPAMPQRDAMFIYQFTGDSRLSDPEVTLRESKDPRTEADLAAELANPPGDPADFSLRTIDGATVLMIINGQQSRAQFLHDGVLFDITGPEVPAAVSTDLATQILDQLGATG